jgi:pimeloyl-ACP methyl ester carboxylesterase
VLRDDCASMSGRETTVRAPDLPGESRTVDVGDVTLHVRTAGHEDRPLVVLLHGFPEFWYCWHEHVPAIANAGFRVVAPDQRGYNRSDKPDDVGAYRLEALTGDVLGLLDAFDADSATLVAHDWGATVAWWTALHHPDRVDRLCVMNVPHPTVFADTLRSSTRQKLRSWYAGFFQLPVVPEQVFSIADHRMLVRALRSSSQPGTFTDAELSRYREAWSQPGAIRGMLNWYRAAARYGIRPTREVVDPETLVLWGARDLALKRSMAYESVDYCRDGRLKMFWDASHWLHHEQPGLVCDAIVGFLKGE